MTDQHIENPILNSPYDAPEWHYRFTDEGITNEVVAGRRSSIYIRPVPVDRRRPSDPMLPGFEEKPEENQFVNDLRKSVSVWRMANYPHTTDVTRKLLAHWQNRDENRFFFCQIEALETAIYMAEAARYYDDAALTQLRTRNAEFNGELFRIAFKMATGSGKTVVMAMLIAWQVLNKRQYPRDTRFANRFLIVTPGITIKDRLRVLQPNEPDNYYRQRDVVPADMMHQMQSARIVITNFHQFLQRERIEASALTKKVLMQGRPDEESPFRESPEQMVQRVCASLGKGEIIVINDEAHHCYKPNPASKAEKLNRDDKEEAKRNEDEARLWFDGLTHVQKRLGIKTIYDLSATPFFLRGSGYGEGTIFPWVVSDFSLVDAIESGIVKIPRVPVSDNTQDPDGTINRLIWENVRDALPTHSKVKAEDMQGEPVLPEELEAALLSLYNDYKARYQQWETHKTTMPPVMIVVCSNTLVSNLMYRFIAGWEKKLPDGTSRVGTNGKLPLFSNVLEDGEWAARPNTILVDSRQLESDEVLSDDFKKVAAAEISAFEEEYRRRYPERAVGEIGGGELLREVLNTVGKRGRLGEGVRCVISVSMLSEGWDVSSVTHILGVRAFSTQLICEQVVGRGLRRMSYDLNEDGKFNEEYAEVYGVPFAFIPTKGKPAKEQAGKPIYHVQSKDSRAERHISFPRVIGYRYEAPDGDLAPRFTDSSRVTLSPEEFPTRTIVAGVVGEESEHTLKMEAKRRQRLEFEIARRVLERSFVDDEGELMSWRFPDVLRVVRAWFDGGYLTLKDNTSLEMLEISEKLNEVVDKIHDAIQRGTVLARPESITPIFAADVPVGSTQGISFDTIKTCVLTGDKSPLNLAVMDTEQAEQVVVQVLEHMPEVIRYVKNYRVGFTIPYSYLGINRSYVPDFIAVTESGLNLIIEVSGERRDDKAAKTDAARLWVEAVNTYGEYGTWAFVEVTDSFTAESIIRSALTSAERVQF